MGGANRKMSVQVALVVAALSAATALSLSTSAAAATAPVSSPPKHWRLHLYNHCPFCYRVELALAWRGIPYEAVYYGYGDQSVETGPKKLLGKKQLPVLEIAEGSYIDESLDIIAHVDDLDGPKNRQFTPKSDRLDDWSERYSNVLRPLLRPRIIQMRHTRDWQDDEDIAYAKAKYTKKDGFSYEDAIARTDELIPQVNALLEELDGMLHSSSSCNAWQRGLDDICLLPSLRLLTCVKGVTWPSTVRAYLDANCKGVASGLYDDHAV